MSQLTSISKIPGNIPLWPSEGDFIHLSREQYSREQSFSHGLQQTFGSFLQIQLDITSPYPGVQPLQIVLCDVHGFLPGCVDKRIVQCTEINL